MIWQSMFQVKSNSVWLVITCPFSVAIQPLLSRSTTIRIVIRYDDPGCTFIFRTYYRRSQRFYQGQRRLVNNWWLYAIKHDFATKEAQCISRICILQFQWSIIISICITLLNNLQDCMIIIMKKSILANRLLSLLNFTYVNRIHLQNTSLLYECKRQNES